MSATNVLLFPSGVRGQFPDNYDSPHGQHSQSSSGVLTATARTCNWKIMPYMITGSVFGFEATVFTCSV